MRELVDRKSKEHRFDFNSAGLQPGLGIDAIDSEPAPGVEARAMNLEKQREFRSCHVRELWI